MKDRANSKLNTRNYLLLCCFTFFSIYLTGQGVLPSSNIFRLQNVATGQYLTAAGGGGLPVTMSATGGTQNTHWKIETSGSYYNIDSESITGGTGVLRAPGTGGPAGQYVVVSTLVAPPSSDIDKTWVVHFNASTNNYRFESRTANRFLYHEANGTLTHVVVPNTDDRSNWKLIPFLTAPDEDTNTNLTCPASGIYQNNNTRNVDLPNAVNVGIADDRTCYSDYSESTVYGNTWGVYNITHNSNHWDLPNTLQPRIERSLDRSEESGVGSYARFTGTLRILEVGDTTGTNNDGTYFMQAKGKHIGGGGALDPAICLFLAKPVYGDDGNGNQVQVSFNIYREQINYRGGQGATGRTIVFLKNVLKNELVDIELEVGFTTDPNNPILKTHYANAIIGGDSFNWNIPEPEKGIESGIRYGAYRVKGGRAQMRWANTTYEKIEVIDNSSSGIIKLQNCATNQYLTAGGGGSQSVTMSATGVAPNTHWTLVKSGAFYNIDSESVSGGTGILRAPGTGGPAGQYVVVSTLIAPPSTDSDKSWIIHFDNVNNTYRFESQTSGRFLYDNPNGTVTHEIIPASDNRSVWKAIITVLPLDFMRFTSKKTTMGVQLNWEIANEINNHYFEILKGNDADTFHSIGRIENKKGQDHYQFLDHELASHTTYYKIKQVDFDGKFSFSKIISVKSNFKPLVIYPNPIRQNKELTIESSQGYQIFNSRGILVKEGTDKTIKIDMEKGIYFIKEHNSAKIQRFMVH